MQDLLLVNVSRMQDVHVDPGARSVRVGAGVKWDRVAPRLSAHGLAGLHGSSPDVGIAGYSLGGGNYGVVTAIEFGVVEVEELYAGALFFPFERAAEVLHTWNAVRHSFPDEMMSWASLLHFPPIPDVPAFARGRSFAIVMAAFLGDEAEGASLLVPLRDLGAERDTFAMVPPVVLGDLAMDPLDPVPFVSTSALLEELPDEGIKALLEAIGPESGRGPTMTLFQLRQMGGALSRVEPGAGARATLPGDISLFTLGAVMDEQMGEAVHEGLSAVNDAVHRYKVGYYPNFVEEPADASTFFDPETWARLRAVKAAYDPYDVFVGNHYIPPA
jgi:FAD/FMN-containing dehydrogenase